jgi:hypothetical protein
MAFLESTRSKIVAAAVAVVVVLAGVGAYVATRPTTQDKADAAAVVIGDLLEREARGDDVVAEGQVVIDQLAEDTGCKFVALDGGAMPQGDAQAAFTAELRADVDAYLAENPGFVVGVDDEGTFGAVVILDCTEAA